MQFTEYGIEGVVPLDLLPSDVRSKYQAKPSDRSKRAKKEETKSTSNQAEENQVSFQFCFSLDILFLSKVILEIELIFTSLFSIKYQEARLLV